VALLTPKSLNLFDRHALYAGLSQRILYFIQLERLYDRFNHFHKSSLAKGLLEMIIENRLALETYEQARCHSAESSECQVKLQKEKGIFSVGSENLQSKS
jgi:hypothetical protein